MDNDIWKAFITAGLFQLGSNIDKTIKNLKSLTTDFKSYLTQTWVCNRLNCTRITMTVTVGHKVEQLTCVCTKSKYELPLT